MADGNNIETLSIGLTLDISQLDANTQKALKNISQLTGGVGNLNNQMGGMKENADKVFTMIWILCQIEATEISIIMSGSLNIYFL